MSVFLSPVGGAGAQFFDNNGNSLTGGKLYTYAAGTTTPQATYTSATGSTFHTNPIILDAAGRVPGSSEIWLADNQIYKFVLKDSNDVLLATWDNITGVNSNFVNYTAETEVQTATAGQTVFTLTTMTYSPGTGSLTVYVDGVNQYEGTSYLETDGTTVTFTAGLHVGALVKFTTAVQTTGNATDASVVTYDPPFTGSVLTTVEDKLAQYVSVKDFGAVGDGITDDTVAIQAALDDVRLSGGGAVYFPAGTYIIVESILVGSKTRIYGDGEASIVKASQSGYVGVNGGSYASQNCQLVKNYNFAAASLTDSDIIVQNLAFDWGTVTISGGGAHSISFRYVDRVRIENVRSVNGENCTALLACRDTVTIGCSAESAINCGFDHWDGSGNCIVAFSTVRATGSSNNQGIQFTGTGSFSENRTTVDCLVTGCSVFGVRNSISNAASAIISNANDNGSQTYRFRSIGNYIEDCDNGIVFEGEGGQHLSMGDTLRDVDALPIFVQFTSPYAPAHCRILDAHLIDCNHLVGNVALVSLSGADNAVRGLRVTNTTAPAYAAIVWLTSNATNNIVEIEKADSGSGVRIFDQGTNSYLADQPYVAWQTWVPVVNASSGTLTTATGAGRYKLIGRNVFFQATATITTNGTGAGSLAITLPVAAKAANSVFGVGRDATSGTLCLWFNPSTASAYIQTTAGAYPGADGRVISISGVYEAA